MFLKSVILVLAVAVGIKSQVFVEEPCPEIKVVENFNLTNYLGTWYGQLRYEAYFDDKGSCSSATYSLNDNGTVRVLNKNVKLNGTLGSIIGFADIIGGGILRVEFPTTGAPAATSPNYYVLDTDYNSYSCVYSCRDTNEKSARFAWILTRERNPNEEVIKTAEAVFQARNISLAEMIKVNQTDCPEF